MEPELPRNEDKMQAFEPTLGERFSGGLQSLFERMGADRYKARQRAQTIMGGPSSNLPLNMGLADVAASVNAPAALAMAPVYASQGMKDLGEAAAAAGRGDYVGAGVEGAFGALNMLPMVSGLTGLAKKAMKPAEAIEEIPYEPPRTNVLRAAEPAPQAAPDVQSVQTVQMPDGRFATSTQLSEVKQIRTGYDTADSPEAVAHLTAGLRKSPQEQLVAVVVDANNKPLQVIRHTIGISNQAQAEPFSLVGAITNVPGAKSYWLSHNHPSGNTQLSNPDIQIAKQVKELTRDTGLEMKGILAIGKDRFGFSDLQNPPTQDLPIPPRARDKTVTMTERTFRRSGVLDKQAISGPREAARIADQIAGDQTGVILLNSQLQPVGFMPLKESELMNLRKSGESNRLLAAMEKANSPRAMLVSNKSLSDAKVGNVSALFNRAGVNLVDVVHGPQRESMMADVGRIPASPTGTFKTIAPIGAGLTAAAVMSPEETYAEGGMIKQLKPLQLKEMPSMPEISRVRQQRHPQGLSEPEAEQARQQSMSRLRRLLGEEPSAIEPFPTTVKMARGGAAKQEVKESLLQAINSIRDKFAKKAEKGKGEPIANERTITSAVTRAATDIQKANPKMADADVAKRAEREAAQRLTWERSEKPDIEARYGLLESSSFRDPLAKRLRNLPEVAEQRARRAEEFLAQPTEPWRPPAPELQAFDRSLIKDALEGFPGIEQTRFPRYQPARADIGYIDEIYDDPRNRELIKKQIQRGLPLGGETFYASLYPLKVAAMERGIPAETFEQFVYQTAPASARNSIMNEMAVGQFLRDMKARGLPLDEDTVTKEMARFKQQYGSGLPLMPVHREGVRKVIEGDLNMRDLVKADIPTNYKIPTYGTQKAGDFGKSVVLDVHEAGGETLASRYHPYFNEQGGFGPTEYGAAENKMMDIANELGIPGGMAQAGRWFGGGELTGLKSPRGDALDLLERQAAYTMQGLGIKPTPANIRNYLLDMIETGEGVLMPYQKTAPMPDFRTQKKEGGEVKSGLSVLKRA